MLRRILLLIDGISRDEVTVESGLWLASQRHAALSILLALDREAVSAPEATAIGGLAAAEHRQSRLLQRLDELGGEARARVMRQLGEAGVEASIEVRETHDAATLGGLIHASDLAVLSRSIRAEIDDEAIERDFLLEAAELLRATARPLLLVAEQALGGGPALIADDGSLAAARALGSAVQLGLLESRTVHLLSVADEPAEAERSLTPSAQLLAAHDLAVEAHAMTGDVSETIVRKLDELEAALLVMGAFGERSLATWLFGSTTSDLLERCAVPILIQA
jgi:nucleotide-binding universal stress UspA family protein